jgi:phosphate starvation-inducible PhoH-like protein|tara:strand:- start:3963 stop:4622 length:660 start_codon:yes stop_codon:yes gene_type:complete
MTQNKDKRLLKTEPRLKVQLNEEQKSVITDFYHYDVNFILGDFGSGKSLTAVYAAVAAFRKKQYNKIWITRPMLANKLAALPGTLKEKMSPYVYPIIQNLNVCQGKQTTERMLKNDDIEIMPIEVAKGITFMDSVVIVDEFQDMDYADFRTILTRLGKESKIIFCGSIEQVDKAIGKKSCIYEVMRLDGQHLAAFNTLTANHRNDSLTKIIRFLENEKH